MSNTLEQQLSDLEKTLKGSNVTEDQQKMARLAIVKQAAQDMTDDEKKEARKAFDEDLEDKTKKSNVEEMKSKKSNVEDESKKSTFEEKEKEAKKSNDEDVDKLKKANEDLEKKVASLTASTNYLASKPFVEKMLAAREQSGMTKDSLEKFRKSLYGKTVEQIKDRYEEDKSLYKSNLSAKSQIEMPEFGFTDNMTSLGASDENITLEAMYN